MMRLALAFCFLLGAWPCSADPAVFQKLPDKPVDLAHDKNLYVIGYAHLDTQWRWTYPYVIQNFIRNTMEQNFPLFEKYPNYTFNFTGSRRYEFMKEYYPEDYAKVKSYVAAGRWFPAGSSVDECDALVPSLESLDRQMLYGNRFFQHEFGIHSDEFMLPDCFGFPASLPEILVHAGIKGFSTQKLTWNCAVGIPFDVGTWIGPDGSALTAALNGGIYSGGVNEDLSHSDSWNSKISDAGQKSGIYADYHYYGTGDRGGSPDDNSVQWVEKSLAGSGPVRVIASRADQMFKDIAARKDAQLPTYKGDLLLTNCSAGSITSQSYMKRWNRQNEQLANAAESTATVADWLGEFPYPSQSLYSAWDLVLGSQMHDIMPGTSLPKAFEYSWNDEVLALNQFARIAEHASAAVVSNLDTTAQGIAVAVYNPLSIAREDTVEASVPAAGIGSDTLTAYDPQGRPVPTQILARDGDTLRVLFLANVQSVGYAIYDLRHGSGPSAAPSNLIVSAHSLENARYRVTLNPGGDVSSIFDKQLQKELLSAPIRLSFHTEIPSEYPAWCMDWEDRQKPARGYVDGPATISIVENGPARVALQVVRQAETSIFTQQIRLSAGSAGDRVEFLDHIDWRSQQASLKADFPLSATNNVAAFDDKVGVTERSTDQPACFEMPMQQWMDLTSTDGSFGVTVTSDSKYGSDKPDDHTLRLTLLYTPGTHVTRDFNSYRDQATQDQGRHEILYALAGHKGGWAEGGSTWQAARVNQPLRAFLTPSHPGSLGRSFSFLSTSSDHIQVVAMKKAEDTDEVVVRLRELTGKPAMGVLLRFPVKVVAAREIDGQERPMGPATITDGQLAVDLKPFGLRAFALKLDRPVNAAAPITSQAVPLTYDTDVMSGHTKQNDGAMDAQGGTYPAELLPAKLTCEGVDFQLGPTADGQMNAVSAHSQSIALPSGSFNRVHLLAAADGDAMSTLKIGATNQPLVVPNWTGYVGQWDNRLWDQPIQELDYDPAQKTVGLVPGYIKRTPVAWYATHHHTPNGDAYYQYSYLFQLSYDLPAGATTVTLPDNPKIKVFAITVSHEPKATPAAAPLYDTLADHQPGGAPLIPQAGQTSSDPLQVSLVAPLYHVPGDLHYTLDGSDPTSASPSYSMPIYVDSAVKIAARQISADGTLGPIVRGLITVKDTAAPVVSGTLVDLARGILDLAFTKKLDPALAADAKNYTVTPPLPIAQAELAPDGQHVALSFGTPLEVGTDYSLRVANLKSTSPIGQVMAATNQPFSAQNVVYRLADATLPDHGVTASVADLPLNKGEAWTLNVLVKADQPPDAPCVIGGFGNYTDDNDPGFGRYLGVFSSGVWFWSSHNDLFTNSPFEIGRWQMLTASYDGKTLTVYKDAELIAKKDLDFSPDPNANVNIGQIDPWFHKHNFQGSMRNFTISRGALNADTVKALFARLKPGP